MKREKGLWGLDRDVLLAQFTAWQETVPASAVSILGETTADMEEPDQQGSVFRSNELELPRSGVRLCRAICALQCLDFKH